MSCHCLCVINHPGNNICKGEATGAVMFSNFPVDSPLAEVGHVEVEMCTPCRIATLTKREVTDG